VQRQHPVLLGDLQPEDLGVELLRLPEVVDREAAESLGVAERGGPSVD
jgi:hypothetical protein